ncbi:30S ribosomal protein S8 [Candidatus Kaiserbacteria bacterium RIFCSPHIGHO2_01_FULL_51_33]|uniref:Small ribosomal subunit protein uS8 n=1 Tax=Candidatus Kaiserbacteria bacterium RIFCSPLOWO2_01_FULL_51_21 TaxID=1798508 RepID=A0A1F6ECI1_9BACT|nr:MAG: 30S ribosomal protein S8 [Candidatus Kaiserbacteria bacterium RIFCSPHIGHO2_01_FULL_51_33]OGG71383.1 MAG: 30S ribosomal protein S8 [Candidatus Kaiserbacteria bacterium RIFCSPLOWO2_01_FULL_51_21]
MVTDPIGDFIIQLKNAAAVKKSSVIAPYSKLRHAVAEALRKEGYLESVNKQGKKVKKLLEVGITYNKAGFPRLSGVKRISKPGRRIYESVRDLRPVKSGKGSLILSTPKGILTDRQARKERVGGEALFKIW